MKNCKNIKSLLSLYVDNCLSPQQAALVKAHLQTCPECEHYLAGLKQMIKNLSDLPSFSLSPEFYVRLNKQLDTEKVIPVYRTKLNKVLIYTRWGLAAAILFFVAAQLVEQNHKILSRKHPSAVPIVSSEPQRTGKIPKKEIALLSQEEQAKETKKEAQQVSEPKTSHYVERPFIGRIISMQETTQQIVATPISHSEPVKEQVIQNLVDKGIPVENAQRTITSAINKGYSVNKLNQIVTNSQSSSVYLSPKRTIQQSGSFKFEEAAPNPITPNGDGFNDEIYFKYQNPQDTEVTIKIYDVTDILIKNIEIVPGKTPAWNGTNENGDLVEGGIYLYILKSGDTIVKGTIILAK